MANAKIELHPESTGMVICRHAGGRVRTTRSRMKPISPNIRRLLDRLRAINGKI